VASARERGEAWLQATVNPDGSWGYHPGAPGQPAPTIFAALAGLPLALGWLQQAELGWAGRLLPALLWNRDEARSLCETCLQRLLEERSQTLDAEVAFDTSIPAWGWVPGTAAWVEPTAHALLSLRRAGQVEHLRAADAIRLLLDRRCTDGGWNYGNPSMLGKELESQAIPTAWALLALSGLPSCAWATAAGYTWLVQALRATPSSHALALQVLAAGSLGQDPRSAQAELAARQGADGAWFGRCDITALSVLALGPTLHTGASWIPSVSAP